MTGFKSVPEIVNEPSNSVKESKNPAKNLQVATGTQDTQTRNSTEKPKNKSKRKSSTGGDSSLDSPTRRSASDGAKQSRHSSSSNTSMDSPREHKKSNLGIEPSLNDASAVPKPSRRKKSKGCEGSARPSKSKGQNPSADTLPDTCQEIKNKKRQLSSVVEANEEGKG
ncbi:PBD domain-containing protein [Melia azedarach]|uniref:PBD domain-containing protein n=1 Tax=Melia azedarach TaxID=155640 RepID=A0ACC1YIA3_MELAZ|nr:PBD domain-containing protein [Melia azedarach]